MIINAHTIILSLVLMGLCLAVGLHFIRAFALQIAQDNHDALLAMDQKEEEKRLKRERDADVAAASAFAKVQPILTTTVAATSSVVSTPAISPPRSSNSTDSSPLMTGIHSSPVTKAEQAV